MHYDLAIECPASAEIQSPSGFGGYSTAPLPRWINDIRAPDTNTRFVLVVPQGSFCNSLDLSLRDSIQGRKMAVAVKQWGKHVFNPLAESHVDDLTETVEATLDFISEFGPEAFSLSGIQQRFVHPEHLAALLRASSTWREQIPGWSEALQLAIAAVNQAGLDPKDVLFGMV